MFSKKISRRSFLKVSAVTTAMAAMGLPAFAAEDTAEENCFQTLNIPRATGSTVDKSVLLDESRLYLITDFGAVSEGDPVQNTGHQRRHPGCQSGRRRHRGSAGR